MSLGASARAGCLFRLRPVLTAHPPTTPVYDLSPFGVVGNSGWNACFLNYFLGSDTTVAPNNGAPLCLRACAAQAQCADNLVVQLNQLR